VKRLLFAANMQNGMISGSHLELKDPTRMTRKVMLMPLILIMLLVTMFPFLFTITLTFTKVNLTRGLHLSLNGIYYWVKLFHDERFWNSVVRTCIIVSCSVSLEYVIGFGLALALWEKMKLRNFFQVLFLIPMSLTPIAIGYTWRMLFHETKGPLNHLLSFLSVKPVSWLTNAKTAIIPIIAVDVWQWTPFILLIMFAALQSFPQSLMEAAKIDGASRRTIFSRIIFPILWPSSLAAIFIRIIECFKIIDTIIILTGGGPGISTESTTLYAYNIGLKSFDLAYGATIAMAFFIIIIVTITALLSAFNRLLGSRYRT
jgi:multiple sugar transport system permease protein